MRIAFFPGCVIPVRYPGIEAATRALAAKLDIDLVDLDFHCCPSPTGLKEANADAWLALAVANLSTAEAEGLDAVTICSGCVNTLREARHAYKNDEEGKRAEAQNLLAALGKEYKGTSEVFQLPDLLAREEYLERLKAACVRPLTGLRVVTHYGCHYYRPSHIMRNEDWPSDSPLPESMELVLDALGADIVEYGRPELCCGAALSYNVRKSDESLQVLSEKLDEMARVTPGAIAVACPACFTQFDAGQLLLSQKDGNLKPAPVYHISELVAYALGTDVRLLDGKRHKIEAPLLAMQTETKRNG